MSLDSNLKFIVLGNMVNLIVKAILFVKVNSYGIIMKEWIGLKTIDVDGNVHRFYSSSKPKKINNL